MRNQCWNLLFAACLGLWGLQLVGQRVTRGSYLQNATDQAITIKWLTDALTDSRVWYGGSPTTLTQIVGSTTLTHKHAVRLSGLQPYTTYYYAVGSSTLALEGGDSSHRFRTNPVPGTVQPIKIWVIGDFGRNNAQEKWVRDAYTDYVTTHRDADVWLWLGDNAYDSGTDLQYQTNVFDIYDSVFAFQPFWPTPGNHDYYSVNQNGFPATHFGPYYDIVEVPYQGEAGGLPSGGEMYYSYDYGNVHFVSLNSELSTWVTSPNSPMAQWLTADLQATQQPWKVVYFHQPPHSRGSHNSDNFWETYMISMRNNYAPILERNGVDLVLCGHSHVYERSRLMYGFYDWSFLYNTAFEADHGSGSLAAGTPYRKSLSDSTQNHGTVYATVGNSGSYTAAPALNHPLMYYGWGCDTCVGSLIIDVHRDTLVARYYASTDTLLDEFAIIKDLTPVQVDAPRVDVSAFEVWPNPFSEQLEMHFLLPKEMNVQVQLLDMQGGSRYLRKLGYLTAGSHFVNLDDAVVDLNNGTYILRLMAGEKVLHQKVIKYRR
jgi:acid phosphatase type 7